MVFGVCMKTRGMLGGRGNLVKGWREAETIGSECRERCMVQFG